MIESLAALARLQLSPLELKESGERLGKVLDYFAQIASFSCDSSLGAELHQGKAATRSDIVEVSDLAVAALAQAPQSAGQLFQVPRVID